MKAIEAKLRESIGLDVAALGRPTLQRTVLSRMQHLGLARLGDYLRVLESSPAHWNELIESVVVAETWFFRDPEAFTALLHFIGAAWLPGAGMEPLRLLSLPCASGEEPYSLAMTLLDAGLSPDKFVIDAVDISARALERARQGSYGRNAFRSKNLGFRQRHFQSTGEMYVLRARVRQCVRFEQGNALDWGRMQPNRKYHGIFCRNLLIYLDQENQARALARLKELLRPDGVLFVGRAEQAVALTHGFNRGHIPGSFTPAPEERLSISASSAEGLCDVETLPPPVHPTRSLLPEPPPALLLGDDLEQAKRLADAGQLKDAALICETHLRIHRDSAAAYYLLGLVREAAGEESALDCYRRALYLDPLHRETLLQMALIAERGGNQDGARVLRRRARRADTCGD